MLRQWKVCVRCDASLYVCRFCTLSHVSPEWQLTGRAEELRFIDAATRPRTGARGMVLAGSAGVGKTRLAREALARAAQRGAAVRWVVATSSARAMPLGVFANLLESVGGDPAQVVRRATDALLAGAGRAGVVVGVDDAHLLDELSAMVVHQLVLRSAATVVLTVRTGEPAPDAVTALWKDGQLDRLEVQPLSEPETAALLAAALGAPLDSAGVSRMWRLTQGNALYLRQLVDGEVDAGRLHDSGGIWRWSGAPTLSPALTELVASRMGALPESVRDVLDILVLGEPLGVALVGQLADPGAVEQAEERGLVHVERDGRRLQARLAHPLYGEVRRTDMGQLRGRRLRGRIATALADAGGRRVDDALRRAVLALESDLEPDAQLLTEAAENAARLFDLPLAERLGRAAVAAGAGFSAQTIVGSAVSWVDSAGDAAVELTAMGELAESDSELARATVARVRYLAWVAAQPLEAEAILAAAFARVVQSDARSQLAALGTLLDAQRGRPAHAAQSAAELLVDAGLGDEAVLMACCGLAASSAILGRADELEPIADRCIAAAAGSTERAGFWVSLAAFQSLGMRLAGYLTDAATITAECRRRAGDAALWAEISTCMVGDTELAQGRLSSALRLLSDARASLESHGDTGGWRYSCLISLTRARALTGDLAATRRTLADLQEHHHPTLIFLEPELLLARTWVAAAEGAVSEAITLAHEAAAVAAGREQLGHEVLALQTAVCFGDHTVADRLAELATMVDGPRAHAAAAHAAALAADDGDALRAASARLEEMGDLLAAADAAAHAATAYARQGRSGSGHAATARAQRLAELCDGARTPALREVAHPLPLTSREREIVTLAAEGLSNQQIADRIVVSVRTVEGHLYRAGAKLGTTSRAELAALLRGD